MRRVSLLCAHCGAKEFTVDKTCIPQGIHLVCAVCGHVTPIAFHDTSGSYYGVNDEASMSLYEESYCRELTPSYVRLKLKEGAA